MSSRLYPNGGEWQWDEPDSVDIGKLAESFGMEGPQDYFAVGGTVFGYADTKNCRYPGNRLPPTLGELQEQATYPIVDIGIGDIGPCAAFDAVDKPGAPEEAEDSVGYNLTIACVLPERYLKDRTSTNSIVLARAAGFVIAVNNISAQVKFPDNPVQFSLN